MFIRMGRSLLSIGVLRLLGFQLAVVAIKVAIAHVCRVGNDPWGGDTPLRHYRVRGQNPAHASEQNHMDEA
jgi:hypothetical protein